MAKVLERREVFIKTSLFCRFTVEEREDGAYLSTYWYPQNESEADRTLIVFETYSAAMTNFQNQIIECLAYQLPYNISLK